MSTTTIGDRYRLTSLLGQGAMGRVWAAHDDLLDREVAVKEVLLPLSLRDHERGELLVRTLREAQTAARVRHPHVVTVFDVVEHDGRPWLVMQRLAPRTLADVLAEHGPLDPGTVARIGLDLLDGLTAVHAVGVVHRDVKPGNVLFTPDGGAVLTDFGIASLDGDPGVTSTGLVLGSPAYLAPERARGAAPTAAADLWSLGATLFAAVEGEAPFHREGPLPTLAALLTEDVPPPVNAGPLAPALAALLTKDPQARPDAGTVHTLLEQALAGDHPPLGLPAALPLTTGQPLADPEPTAAVATALSTTGTTPVRLPRPRRRALLAAAALAAVVLPVAALADRGPAGGSAAADAAVVQAVPPPTRSPAATPPAPTPRPTTKAATVSRASSPARSTQATAPRRVEQKTTTKGTNAKGKGAAKKDSGGKHDRKGKGGKRR